MWYKIAQEKAEQIQRGRKFPWFDNPEEITARRFNMRQVPDSDRYLVTPSPTKWEWDYDPSDPYGATSELNWRSSLLDNEGYEISGGLPKFMNFGEKRLPGTNEYSSIDKSISDSIATKNALLTLKEDGSLVIRSVHNGEVILRTRGSHQLPTPDSGTDFKTEVVDIISQKFPILLNPNFLPELDLYFEYVAPTNRIIVTYAEPDLVFLHAKERATQKMVNWSQLESIAQMGNLKLVSLVEALNKAESPEDLKYIIDHMETTGEWPHEGIVIRSPEGYMSKIKGEDYLTQHRLKAMFNYKKLVEVCETRNIKTREELHKYLTQDLGMDWETIVGAEEMFEEYKKRRDEFDNLMQDVIDYIQLWKEVYAETGVEPRELKKKYYNDVKDFEHSYLYLAVFNKGVQSLDVKKYFDWMMFDK